MHPMALRRHSQSHKECRQHGKDIGLNESDEQFQKIDGKNEDNRNRGKKVRTGKENEAQKREDDDVAAAHVRKETHAESECLRATSLTNWNERANQSLSAERIVKD